MIESYELIELLCELVHERIKYIASEKECPDDLKQAVYSLIWSIPRVDVIELVEVRRQLVAKYGKQFAEDASNNTNNIVNERLFEKLSVKPPSSFLVTRYLQEIAKEYKVDWSPPEESLSNPLLPVPSPQGFSIAMAPGSDLSSAYQRPNTNNTNTTNTTSTSTNNLEPTYYPVERVEPIYAAIPTAPASSSSSASASSFHYEPQIAIPIESPTMIEKMNNNNNNNNSSNTNNSSSDNSNDNNNDISSNNNNSTNNSSSDSTITKDSTSVNGTIISASNTDSTSIVASNTDNNTNTSIELDELTARFNALK